LWEVSSQLIESRGLASAAERKTRHARGEAPSPGLRPPSR
jgi:hypothetical protein